MSWNVFVSRQIPEPGIQLLRDAGFKVDVYNGEGAIPRDILLSTIPDYDAILPVLTEKIDTEFLDKAIILRIVANFAVGYNNIDVPACTKRKIAVTNTPDVLTDATADLTFTLILAVAKRIIEGDKITRAGQFKGWGPLMLLGSEVTGKTLGIIGPGRIGYAVAKRASGFQMKILYHGNSRKPMMEQDCNAEFVSLEELFSGSDFVSIHVPLNPETHHLINEEQLAKMKPSSFLINTSRGPVVDEKALVIALQNKQIAGAGLDVFENEPELAHGLADLPNTVLVPHIASATVETRTKMALMAAENIVSMFRGEIPLNILNREIF